MDIITIPGEEMVISETAEIMIRKAADIFNRPDEFTPLPPGAVVTKGRPLATIILEGLERSIAKVKVVGPQMVWEMALTMALEALMTQTHPDRYIGRKPYHRKRNEICGSLCYGILGAAKAHLDFMEYRAIETEDAPFPGRRRKRFKSRKD